MPNDGQVPSLSRSPLGYGLWALALVAALALAGCAGALSALAGRGAQATPVAPATPTGETLDEFTQRLAGAILEKDAAALAAMMAPDFHLAAWQGRGRILAPQDAAAEIVEVYLAASPAAFDTTLTPADVAARLGRDPLTMWPGVEGAGTLYLTGLVTDGIAEAVLVIAGTEAGGYAWAGMLVGPEGFGQAGEVGGAPASALPARLDILHAVEVLAAPDAGAEQVGVLNFGQVVAVLGASAGGDWWQIQCPAGVAGECWVQNDPQSVAALGNALASPAETPPPIPTATPTIPAATPTPLPPPTPIPTATPTALPPPSPTPVPPTATPTQPPPPSPTPAPPTVMPTPTEGPPRRVTFGEGQTAVVLDGVLGPGGLDRYLLRAVRGQTMYVGLTSDTGFATFGVYGYQDGSVLKRYEVRGDSWSGVLPASQDYLVTVANGGGATTRYSLSISFSPLETLPPTPAPTERIRFAPGATSATVDGTLAASGTRSYVLEARGGQRMDAWIESPGRLILGIRGANGANLLEPAAGQSSASVLLTTTQDYVVTVYNVGGAADFSLTTAIY